MTTVKTFIDKTAFSCNGYVVSGEQGVVVIDPGYYGDDLRECLHKQGRVDAVLLTHAHIDHLRGVNALKNDFPSAPVYIGKR